MVIMEAPGKENATGKPDVKAIIIIRTRRPRNNISMNWLLNGLDLVVLNLTHQGYHHDQPQLLLSENPSPCVLGTR